MSRERPPYRNSHTGTGPRTPVTGVDTLLPQRNLRVPRDAGTRGIDTVSALVSGDSAPPSVPRSVPNHPTPRAPSFSNNTPLDPQDPFRVGVRNPPTPTPVGPRLPYTISGPGSSHGQCGVHESRFFLWSSDFRSDSPHPGRAMSTSVGYGGYRGGRPSICSPRWRESDSIVTLTPGADRPSFDSSRNEISGSTFPTG